MSFKCHPRASGGRYVCVRPEISCLKITRTAVGTLHGVQHVLRQILRHVMRHVLRRVLRRVLCVLVLHVSPKASVGGGARVLSAGSAAERRRRMHDENLRAPDLRSAKRVVLR